MVKTLFLITLYCKKREEKIAELESKYEFEDMLAMLCKGTVVAIAYVHHLALSTPV
jgi:hypothetical protein